MYWFKFRSGDYAYIGKSFDPKQRFKEHKRDYPDWFRQWERYPGLWDSKEYDSEDEALAVEASMIAEHRPMGNLLHNPETPSRRVRRRLKVVA